MYEYIWMQESMSKKDHVWDHRENFFLSFKCKFCLKIWRGRGATRVKGHLAGRTGNIVRSTKCPLDIREYFSCELQMVKERKKFITEKGFRECKAWVLK
jgi:hypothetical protein